MDKDLEKFENRSDDWLAKQKKAESKVSAWDFDEGKRVKNEHEENCEAKEIKETHERRHAAYKRMSRQQGNSNTLKVALGVELTIALIIMIGFLVVGIITGLVPGPEIIMGLTPLLIVIIVLLLIVRRKR